MEHGVNLILRELARNRCGSCSLLECGAETVKLSVKMCGCGWHFPASAQTGYKIPAEYIVPAAVEKYFLLQLIMSSRPRPSAPGPPDSRRLCAWRGGVEGRDLLSACVRALPAGSRSLDSLRSLGMTEFLGVRDDSYWVLRDAAFGDSRVDSVWKFRAAFTPRPRALPALPRWRRAPGDGPREWLARRGWARCGWSAA
jgi:hypothetical protein